MADISPAPATGYCPSCGRGDCAPTPEAYEEQRQRTTTAEHRLRLAHQARRAKEHQLDDIRRALCDAGFMEDDDPYSHADLADVIRQNGQTLEAEPAQAIRHDPKPTRPTSADDETVSGDLFDEISRRHRGAIDRVDELLAAMERVRAFATRLEEFAEHALRNDDRKLYAVVASDLRARIDGPSDEDISAVTDPSWAVQCRPPGCGAQPGQRCRRWDGNEANVSCGSRWREYDRQQAARTTDQKDGA